jgi:hypothetical protein
MALITAFFSKFTLNGNGLNSTNKKTELWVGFKTWLSVA